MKAAVTDSVWQALFNSLPEEDVKGTSLVLGGDGRYFNKEAAQVCDILPPTIAM
jgi:phosphoglucomutase